MRTLSIRRQSAAKPVARAQGDNGLDRLARRLTGLVLPLLASAAAALTATPAAAQNYDLLIRQALARQNAVVNQAQNQVQRIVQQRMQDPAVQAAYQRYVQQSGGRPAMDYPTYTYYYIYTNGFSAQGMAHMRANEGAIREREAPSSPSLRRTSPRPKEPEGAHRKSDE